MSCKRLSACCHSPHFSQALIAELKVKVLGKIFSADMFSNLAPNISTHLNTVTILEN